VNCVAIENEESERLLAMRTKEAMQPKLHTKFVKGDLQIHGQGFIQPGTNEAANSSFSTFIKTNNRPGPSGKVQQQKTARMPENDLRDALFRCFRKYNYWSMKALRNELKQPEAYLKQQLDYIAILAKSGRFATHWSLKPEMKEASGDQDAALLAPPVEGDGGMEDSDMADEEDEDEDGDVKFEDVA
jgi:transcription initiation factor TFIIF subunit beta